MTFSISMLRSDQDPPHISSRPSSPPPPSPSLASPPFPAPVRISAVVMRLARSTFVALYLARGISGFVAPARPPRAASSAAASASRGRPSASARRSTRLRVGLHDQPAYQVSDDEIKRESMFREVLKEVNAVRDYLDWLVEEGAAAAAEDAAAENGGEAAGGKIFADVLAERASAAAEGGEVELFGGGGDAPASSEAPKDTEYRPSLRSDLGSSVLLTGTVDPGLLSVLNNNFFGRESVPNFQFSTIKALVDDVAGAKKRAIGREARYGGLLDKLVVEEASGALPSAEELGGATCWIAEVTAGEAKQLLPQMAALASGASELENLVVMVTGSSGTVEGWDAVKSSAEAGSFKATLLSVGDLYDGGSAGGFCHVGRLGEDLTPAEGRTAKLSKAKAYQLLAHLLALDCASNVELAAYEYSTEVLEKVVVPYGEGEFAERDDEGKELPDEHKDVKMEQRMVRAVREAGFTPVMELDVLLGRGLAVSFRFLRWGRGSAARASWHMLTKEGDEESSDWTQTWAQRRPKNEVAELKIGLVKHIWGSQDQGGL
ncbi:hypothetical protein ACHAWF_005397 [Thalassiosira exigua]